MFVLYKLIYLAGCSKSDFSALAFERSPYDHDNSETDATDNYGPQGSVASKSSIQPRQISVITQL